MQGVIQSLLTLFSFVLLIVLLLRQFIINTDWRTTDEEITKFIADHNIQNASIKKNEFKKILYF